MVQKLAHNQFIHTCAFGMWLQSYDVCVAVISDGTVYLNADYWDYSKTTIKYTKQFISMNCSKKEIEKKIKNGQIKSFSLPRNSTPTKEIIG